jgi:hypothetical protein
MEEMNFITELINTMGFPIVMVGYFIWDKNKCMSQMCEAIKNNTMMLEKILTKWDMDEKKVNDDA